MKRGGKQDILLSLDKSTFGTAAHLANANISTLEKGMTAPRQVPTNQAIAKQLAFTTTYSLNNLINEHRNHNHRYQKKAKKQWYGAIYNQTERSIN